MAKRKRRPQGTAFLDWSREKDLLFTYSPEASASQVTYSAWALRSDRIHGPFLAHQASPIRWNFLSFCEKPVIRVASIHVQDLSEWLANNQFRPVVAFCLTDSGPRIWCGISSRACDCRPRNRRGSAGNRKHCPERCRNTKVRS